MITSSAAPLVKYIHSSNFPQTQTPSAIDPLLWRNLEIHCKCDCITPLYIPKDIAPLEKPVIGYLELTTQCNSSCAGCNYSNRSSHFHEQSDLNFEQWKTIINKLLPSVQRLQITGGEAILHPEFFKIITYIDHCRIPYVIFSNGLWSAPSKLLSLLKSMRYFDGFLISLHGAEAKTHETFSGISNSFETILGNIKLATEMNFSVFTSTVLFKANYQSLDKIEELARKIGTEYSVFNRFIGNAPGHIALSEVELLTTIEQLTKMQENDRAVRFGNCIPQCFARSKSSGCFAGTAFLSIDAFGNAKPCNHSSLTCGNLLSDSLEQVWYSSSMQSWRELIPQQCNKCTEFSNCHGGCRAETFRVNTGQDPLMKKRISNQSQG